MKFGLDLAPHHKVFGAFAIYSFTMGNIFPRFADLRNFMGVEEGAFGFGLIGAPLGTLISLTLGAAAARKDRLSPLDPGADPAPVAVLRAGDAGAQPAVVLCTSACRWVW